MKQVDWPFIPAQRNIEISRAEGVYLYDHRNRPILDAAGGAIVASIGHGDQRVVDKVAEATRKYSYVVPTWLTPSRRALVEILQRDWLPAELSRIHLTSGGSESVESAIKMALQYQAAKGEISRTKIITRTVSYHGTTVATTAASGHPPRKKGLAHALPDYPQVPTPYPLRCPLGAHHADAGQHYVDLLRARLEAEGPNTVAAFLAEPITGSSGGAIVPPDDYWTGVRKLCDEYGVLLIMDEVMTGFGRTGLAFGYQHWNATPDILVAGKGLAGGYAPLGGVFAHPRIADAIAEAGYNVMFHTFGAHPAACAAAAEVLSIVTSEGLIQRCAAMGELLGRRLNEAFADHPCVAEVRGRGLLRAIEIVKDRDTLEQFPAEAAISNHVVGYGLKNGVFFYGGGTGEVRDIVCMGPPFTITEAHVETIVNVLHDAVTAHTR